MSGGDAISTNLKAALRWPPNSGKFRLLAAILLLLSGVYAAVFLVVTAQRMAGPPAGDFFALWSAARFVYEHPVIEIYDPAALKAAQLALGMDPGTNYPFPYPPCFLLLLAPLGLLPYAAAYAVAMTLTLALYVWATVPARQPWLMLAAVVAPTTTITLVAGQAGLFAAALLAGGFRLARTRPVAAGVLFGLATYKPQIGLLVPVALVAAGLWRTIAAACATVTVLTVVTGIAFGPAIWPAWVANIAQYSAQFAAESSEILYLMPTVSAALVRLGFLDVIVQITQLAVAIASAGAVWYCFRKGPDLLTAAVLFAAAFLATPHAFVYDMPILTTGVLWFVLERQQSGTAFDFAEILAMMLVVVAPITLVAGGSGLPLMLLSLLLFLGLVIRRIRLREVRPA